MEGKTGDNVKGVRKEEMLVLKIHILQLYKSNKMLHIAILNGIVV